MSSCYGAVVPRPRPGLPLADEVPVERADAARNRRRILESAARVFATRRPGEVTMDDIAKAAGVGRATLYRRYATVGAVAEALLDEHERKLQEQLLGGEPPLGPGAPPGERLAAFYDAMVDLLDQHATLVLGTEIGQLRFGTGAYGFWRSHVHHLVQEAGIPDTGALPDILLAPLDPALFLHQRERGVTTAEIATSLRSLAHAVLRPPA